MVNGVDISDKIVILYFMHFGNKNPDLATCKDCDDYELGFCCGGAYDVMDCMYEKAERCEFFGNVNLSDAVKKIRG
jgi:hypothetical protein